MKIILTKKKYKELQDKLYNLQYKDQPTASEQVAECRPIGCLEDNPEYLQAMENLAQINKQVTELQNVLANAIIYNRDKMETNRDEVAFGCTVSFKNLETDVEKTYTILSVYDSDINNNIISIEAPLVKQMIGLTVGDYFYFRENEFEITNISYSFQE